MAATSSSTFTDKVAIVTGSTTGIGKGIALALASAGAKVVVSGRRESEGAAVVDEITKNGGTASFYRADVSKEETVEGLVKFALETYGRLDLAVNNAGVESGGPTVDITEDEYRRVFDINVWGVLASLKHEIAALLKSGGGSIVNISSVVGQVGMPGAQIYTASKHAVEGITKSVALEYAKQGIRVNAVAPAVIETDMFARFAQTEEAQNQLRAMHPVGHSGQPNDVAKAVLYLLDPFNTFVTGITVPVDGGLLSQ